MRKDNKQYALWQRIGALALAAVLVFSMVPATSAAESNTGTAGIVDTWSDPETLTRPETIYGDNTLNAGKVTVGKSVSDSGITVDGQSISLSEANNFLVTISQSAQVMGLASQSNVPVDVVFVLDTSGSMDDNDRAETLVTAANSAIATLMTANEQNRVAVVAFSSEGSYGGGTSGGAAANVLSSLAHYTGDAASSHLRWVSSQGGTTGNDRNYIAGRDPATIEVNGQTRNVTAFRHGKNGGTNIQAGIIEGARILTGVQNTTYTDPETNETVTRIPFLIVLSDGQPTFTYDDETWYDPDLTGQNAADEQGPGSSSYEGNGFIAALTAAYYKGAITEHYYGSSANAENHCFVYTMGVELGTLSGDDAALAQITLDPTAYTTGDYAASNAQSYYNYGNSWNDNNRSSDYGWKTYWASYVAGEDFAVRINRTNNRNVNYTFTAESIAASKAYVNGVGYTGGLAYNDAYFGADSVDEMEAIFEALVRTIQEKAISVPTKVSTGDHDFDGYVTFTDPIGEYMEVKEIKGIVADGNYYRGASAANYLLHYGMTGDANNDPEFDALLRTVLRTRMGLSDSDTRFGTEAELDAFINELLTSARDSQNQANYTSSTDFDNSVVWWGSAYNTGEEDEQVQVLGFADNDTIGYITDSATVIPEGADYVCRSYFFYGTAGGTVDNPNHEYLYFMVRVQRELTAPYRQTVVISAPASLLSMEKVLITESTDDDGNTVYTASVEEASPARVVYEVGLWDTITAENVSAVVSADYAVEVPADGKGQANVEQNADGADVYHFFTNDWDRTETQASHHRAMARATFDAAPDNAFYTYQEDTLMVDAQGNPVTGDPRGTTVYYVREYYDWADSAANGDGTYTAVKRTALIEVQLPADAELVEKDGQWYIPAGAYTAATLVVNGDDTVKSENVTDTSEIVAHPHRTGDSSNSHYTVYLGNNGVLSLVSEPPVPEKTVANITTSIADADGKAVMVGDVLEYTVKARNYGVETVDIIITDTVPAGTEYVADSATNGGVYDAAAGVITWTIEDVAPGAEVSVSFRVQVSASALDNAVVSDTIHNTATVRLGGNGPAYDSNTTTNPPEGKKVTALDGTPLEGEVTVGSVLQYAIEFHNDTGAVAEMTITDVLPQGTTFLSADHGGVYDAAANTITWTFTEVQPGAGGVVTFQVEVDASAKTPIENGATIRIGENDPRTTNTTETDLAFGDLRLTKLLAQGDSTAAAFTLTLTESGGKLNGTYTLSGSSAAATVTFVDGKAQVTIYPNETLTVEDLPAGAVITVVETAAAGWTPTYSSGSVTIVADDPATTAVEAAAVTVTNDYYAEPAKFQLRGTKIFSGANFPAGTFTFRAREYDMAAGQVVEGGIVVTAVAVYDGSGSVVFSFSERTFAAETDRYYLITEDSTAIPGVTTSGQQYLLHLVVEDDGAGKMVLTARISTDGGAVWSDFDPTADQVTVSFTNTYAPKETSVTIGGTKTLSGRYLVDGEFSFQLVDPVTGAVIATASNTADSNTSGSFTFPSITYTAADMDGAVEKTFTYYIREVNSGAANTTYDPTYYEVKVTVKDVNGALQAAYSVYKYVAGPDGTYPSVGAPVIENAREISGIAYSNAYTVQDISVTLTGTKTLTGEAADGLAAGEFSFSVYETDSTGTTKGGLVSSGTNAAGAGSAAITFAPIGFTAADMADSVMNEATGLYEKDFWFLVEEDIPASLTKDPNMYYDPARYLVKVTVTYNPNGGTLSVGTPTYQKWDEGTGAWTVAGSIAYENIQNPADVKITPVGTKTTGNAPDGISFSFSVIDTVTGKEAAAGVGAANGRITFSTMSFTEPGTYTYWIVESNAGNTTNGITYDATRYLMQVVVTRDSTNKLQAEVTYWASGVDGSTDTGDYTTPVTAPGFENAYAANGYINITASKSFNATLHDGDFAFKLVRQDNGGVIEGIVSADGTVRFATMYYSLADIPEGQDSTVIHYVMSEVIPESAKLPGVTYDTSTHDVYVQITDNGDGTISAQLVKPEGDGYVPVTDGEGNPVSDTGVTFVNTYTVTRGTEVTIRAAKTLTGRSLAAGEFGFALYRYDAAEDRWLSIGTAFNGADGAISFTRYYNNTTLDHLAFGDDDTYTVIYRMDEINNNLGGITYSGDSYYVKVVIAHDEDTSSYSIVAGYPKYYTDEACTEEAEAVVFANAYTTNDTHFTPEASKVLLGANGVELSAEGFTFEVIEVNADGTFIQVQSGSQMINKVVSTGTSDADGSVTFSNVLYSNETDCAAAREACTDEGCTGTVHNHYYVIRESAGSAPGVTYSQEAYYIKVTIHDNGKGVLELTDVVYYSDAFQTVTDSTAVVFTNHYGPGYMTLDLALNKAFRTESGAAYHYALEGSEFDFEVYADEACTQLVTTGTNGPSDESGVAPITFGSIVIDEAGEYTYYIKEVSRSGAAHIGIDATVIKAAVTVTDDGYGNLSAQVVYTNAGTGETLDTFTNTYKPAGTSVSLEVNKVLSGKDLAGETFTFVLRDASGNPVGTWTKGENGKYTVAWDYTAPDMSGAAYENGVYTKVFTYTLTETATVASGSGDGTYTYDTTVYTVTVTLTDDGSGQLRAGVSVTKDGEPVDAVVFRNTYTPDEITVDLDHAIGATKTITDDRGNVLERGDVVFTFEVKDLNGNVVATGTAKGADAADGIIPIDFGTFTFSTAGEHRYLITERAETLAGYVLDTNIWCAHIQVRYDAAAGKLYIDEADVYTHLLTGSAGHEDGTDEAAPAFVNVYRTNDIDLTLNVEKHLEGRDLQDREFTFHLLNADGTIAAEGRNNADGTVSFYLDYTLADLDGALSREFKYTVREILPEGAVRNEDGTYTYQGVTYDTAEYTVTVRVTDNGDGTLSAHVAGTTVTGDGTVSTGIRFKNTYEAADVSVALQALKRMEGMPLTDGVYTFQLLDSEGNVVAEATNKADGSIIFGEELTFTEAGTYVYTMVEYKGSKPGVTFDETSFTVTVIVTDDLVGNLQARVVYSTEEGTYDMPVFINIYEPEGVNVVLEAQKELTGRDLAADEFAFQLIDSEGNVVSEAENAADGTVTFDALHFDEVGTYIYTVVEVKGALGGVTYDETVYTVTVTVTDEGYDGQLDYTVSYRNGTEDVEAITFTNAYAAEDSNEIVIEGTKTLTGKDLAAGAYSFSLTDADGKVIETVTNTADGKIVFSPLSYTFADMDGAATKTFTYTVSEVQGTDENTTYDEAVYTVTVTVTDDGNGKLTAVADYGGRTVAFANIYTNPITVTLEGTKQLTGRDLQAGEFRFEVRDAEGNLITTGTNTADGKITFADIVVEGETALMLYVTEVKGSDNQIVYDDYTYRVKLIVTNDNGVLKADVTYLDGEIVFYNEYESPETPDTGDDTPVHIYGGMMGVSVLAMAALLLLGRKKKERVFC